MRPRLIVTIVLSLIVLRTAVSAQPVTIFSFQVSEESGAMVCPREICISEIALRPFAASISVPNVAVIAGEATLADVIDFTFTAGDVVLTLADLEGPPNKIFFSPDGSSISGFESQRFLEGVGFVPVALWQFRLCDPRVACLGGQMSVSSLRAGWMFRDNISPSATAVGTWGPLALSLSTNQLSFSTGDALTASLAVNNPGLDSVVVDFYFGAVLPDGDTVAFFTNLDFNFAIGTVSNLSTLSPIVAGVDLSSPFVVDDPSFFSFVWTGAEPAGSYTMFLAAVLPGGFADGTADPGDIIALGTAGFTFTP